MLQPCFQVLHALRGCLFGIEFFFALKGRHFRDSGRSLVTKEGSIVEQQHGVIPLCRISQLYTRWPPACPGLHVFCSLFLDGPPALSGFPYTHIKASAIRRLPSVCKSSSGPPASSGFPVVYNSASGIDRPPTILRCIVSQGLPLGRASHIHTSRPPAYAGFQVYVDPVVGLPHRRASRLYRYRPPS